jgi:PAS domain-containing protein
MRLAGRPCDTSAMAEPLLAEMADELPAAVAVFGPDGAVQYANPALADSLGVPPGSLTGRDLAMHQAGTPARATDTARQRPLDHVPQK